MTSPCSWPTRLTAQTKTPLAMAWARWMAFHAEYCAAPNSDFSLGCQPMAVGMKIDCAPSSAVRRAASGNHWSQQMSAPDGAVRCGDGAEAQVAGREVELLVEQRVVGDVHLAVDAGDVVRPGRFVVQHGDGVVVEAGGAPLEQGRDQRDLRFSHDRGKTRSRRAGDGFGQGEEAMVLALAEVLRAEELGQADQLCAGARGLADEVHRVVEVLLDGGRAGHLDQGDADGIGGHGV